MGGFQDPGRESEELLFNDLKVLVMQDELSSGNLLYNIRLTVNTVL